MPSADYVLVVDDDPDMVEIILLVLRDAGYEATSVANGKQALEVIAQRMPALLLLDMMMPVMDGWECGRILRTRYGQDLPIVVITAAEHAAARGAEIGADAVLPKPFDLGELLKVVGRYARPR